MVLAIRSAWLLLMAKSCTPFCVVNDTIIRSGWFSGQPVAKPVTKSAEVDRFVIEDVLSGSLGRSGSFGRLFNTDCVDAPTPNRQSIYRRLRSAAHRCISIFGRCQAAPIRRYG